MKKLCAFAALFVVSSLSVASADTKAWTTARDNLPGDTPVAVSVDMQAIAKTATYAKFLPMLTGKDDVKTALALIKDSCKIDALTLISSITIAGSAASEDGVVYISMPGFGQKKAVDCVKSMAANSKDKGTVTANTDGNITELTDGKSKKIYVGFIGEVAVIAPKKIDDKDALKKWMGGGGAFAKGTLGKLLAKANASAAIFGGSVEAKQMKDTGLDIKTAFGWMTLTSGTVGVELHGEFTDAKAATKMVDDANKQIAEFKKNPPMPALVGLMKNMTLVANGTEAVLKASAKEDELLQIATMLGVVH
jgi:hypothetical protein